MGLTAAPLRFAIVGAGEVGRLHAEAIAAVGGRASLAVVADSVPGRAHALAAAHGAEAVNSLAAALERADVDAVAICTPSGDHGALAVAALDAGRHVVVEKPLDVTVEAARAVADAAARSDRTVTVISQHRFDPAARLVHEHVVAGTLGRITSGVASVAWWRTQDYYDSGDWRGTWSLDGGGALMNQGIHTLDLLVWLLGEPLEVFGWSGCLAHERIEVEDTVVATIRFASGALGAVLATTAAYPGVTARLAVHGERGSAVIEDDRLAYFHAAADGADVGAYGAGAGANQAPGLSALKSGAVASADPGAISAAAHAEQYRDFLDAIGQRRLPLVSVADGVRNIAVIRAIYESAATGRASAVAAATRGR